MKSAEPSDSLDLVHQSLNRKPVDIDLIAQVVEENPELVSIVLSAFSTALNEVREISARTNDLLSSIVHEKNNALTPTTLAKFFTLKPEILTGYNYSENKLFYKDTPLEQENDQLILLSLDLEAHFGNKHINFSTLLSGMKRYFVAANRADNYVKEFIDSQCNDYLAIKKTRKRTRVPLKFIRSCCSEVSVSLSEIRTIMTELGYREYKDANKVVFFIKEV